MSTNPSTASALLVKKTATPEKVAKRMLWLAYIASYPMGLGVLHYTDKATEDDVIKACVYRDGRLSADYLFGRMMKFFVGIKPDGIEFNTRPISSDYQSWMVTYRSYDELFDAAVKSLSDR